MTEQITGRVKRVGWPLGCVRLSFRFRDQCTQTLDHFRGIFATLKKRPRNIEELTEMKEFISDIPSKLERLAYDIKSNLHTFEILEDFKYKVGSMHP